MMREGSTLLQGRCPERGVSSTAMFCTARRRYQDSTSWHFLSKVMATGRQSALTGAPLRSWASRSGSVSVTWLLLTASRQESEDPW